MLAGKKSYLCGIAIVFVVGMETLGWITPEAKAKLIELIGAGAILALRAGMSKL
jgi:hypothetical protein